MGLSTRLSTAILAELPSCLTKIASFLTALWLDPTKAWYPHTHQGEGPLKLSGPVIPLLQALQQLPPRSKQKP